MSTASLGCGDGANAAGNPEQTYPAFPIDAPQVVRADGGAVMTAPTVRLIPFAGDPLQADIAKLVEQVREPAYWTATTQEYGVGPLSIGAPIVLDEVAPSSADGSTLESWLAGKFEGVPQYFGTFNGVPRFTYPDGGDADFGTPDERTIYLVVYPAPTTLISAMMYACGFHGGVRIGGKAVHYAAVTDCASTRGREAEVNDLGPPSAMSSSRARATPIPNCPRTGTSVSIPITSRGSPIGRPS